jgi:hypothetical protein
MRLVQEGEYRLGGYKNWGRNGRLRRKMKWYSGKTKLKLKRVGHYLKKK